MLINPEISEINDIANAMKHNSEKISTAYSIQDNEMLYSHEEFVFDVRKNKKYEKKTLKVNHLNSFHQKISKLVVEI